MKKRVANKVEETPKDIEIDEEKLEEEAVKEQAGISSEFIEGEETDVEEEEEEKSGIYIMLDDVWGIKADKNQWILGKKQYITDKETGKKTEIISGEVYTKTIEGIIHFWLNTKMRLSTAKSLQELSNSIQQAKNEVTAILKANGLKTDFFEEKTRLDKIEEEQRKINIKIKEIYNKLFPKT